ncbi:MAG TPA: hypothetical protein VEW03_08230 [Longimicrobiaceae bacterium]|nr:hypothetical protein [Longimicrobiaceae bacterium]
MPAPPSSSRPSEPSRRPRVPPALRRGPERFDGLAILDEVAGDLGLVLWRSVRNVLLWAETPGERRGMLFAAGAAQVRRGDLAGVAMDGELLAPMSVIASLLEAPGAADVPRLVNACRRVAAWAEHRGSLATALEFTQAAALAAPDSAALAYAVGRLARRRADFDRAETWYARAIIQGRQTREWKAYALAFSGMGNLHIRRGNFPAARKAHQRCLLAARRHGFTELQGDAYHDLFAVAVETGAGFEADALAARALEAYGHRNDKIVRLAFDVAYHWVLQGYFAPALTVWRALRPAFARLAELPVLLALTARAAAACGHRAECRAAAAEAGRLLAGSAALEMAARTLLSLAHAAAYLGDWEEAAARAEEALAHARKHGEGRIVLETESTLEMVRRRQGVLAAGAVRAAHDASLADELVSALAGLEAAGV